MVKKGGTRPLFGKDIQAFPDLTAKTVTATMTSTAISGACCLSAWHHARLITMSMPSVTASSALTFSKCVNLPIAGMDTFPPGQTTSPA